MAQGSTNAPLTVRYQPIATLRPYPRNARTHSRRQIRQIADSISAFGFNNPVLVDGKNQIAAGHGRVEAAKLLSIETIPTISLDELSDDQIRAYILADNKLAESAGWDKNILAIELQHLMTIENFDFDVTLTGFQVSEIDLILGQPLEDESDQDDISLIGDTRLAVSARGDLWQLGKHQIFCGDALDDASYKALMGKKRAAAVFSDAPYNVPIDGHATGNGAIHHREFEMASGEMTEEQFEMFLTSSLSRLAEYSSEQSVHYLCIDWRSIHTLLKAGNRSYERLLNICVWVKDNAGLGSFYRSQHELIAVFRKGKSNHRNNVQLGRFGRNRTNVWKYPGVSTLSKQSDEGNLLALHPTVKPTAMVADALLDCTKRGDVVLDAFLGSGTTLTAAERIGRICRGIEIDPFYVDTAVRRWQKQTGDTAVYVGSGKSFDQVEKEKYESHA